VLGFSQIPFFRILLCFGIGLTVQLYLRLPIIGVFIAFTSLFVVVFLLRYKNVAFVFRILALSVCIMSVGALFIELRLQKFYEQPKNSELSSFLVKKELSSNESWNKYQIESGNNGLLYVAKELGELNVGGHYSVSLAKQKVVQDALPKRFDYPLYLKSKGYFFTAFIKSTDTIYLTNKHSAWLKLVAGVRNSVYSRLELLFGDKEIKAFYSAILLGDKSWLNQDTQSAFATLGISHFLAVSGLHVGIIYILLSLVLGLTQYKKHKWLMAKLLLVVAVIWMYAILSGFSVSVVRASFMFTCFLFARALKRGGNGFNILCFSAFVTLLINPLAFYDVGFQLSYAAVASIVLLHPKMQSLLSFRYRASNYLWDALCLSTCAQLGTLPIILYTFGYFPVWFLVSNLWLALFGFILTASAFLFLFIAYIPLVGEGFAFLSSEFYKAFLWGVSGLESLPFSKVIIFLERKQMMVLLVMLGFWFVYLYSKKRSALLIAITLSLGVIVWPIDKIEYGLKEINVGNRKYYIYQTPTKKWLFPLMYNKEFEDSFVKNNADNSLFKDYYRLPKHIRRSKKYEMVVLRILDGNGNVVEKELK
jgi:competence protein ComEC